jgi:hypothetical protein
MLEQMLKEFLIKLIREDRDVQTALIRVVEDQDLENLTYTVKNLLLNSDSIESVIRKQATTDIWEAIEDDVNVAIGEAIDNLTFDITVSR